MNDPRHPVSPHHPTIPQPTRPAPPHPPPPRPAAQPAQPVAPPARPGIAPVPTMKPPADDLEPIALIEEEPEAPPAPPSPGHLPSPQKPPAKMIKAFGVDEHRAQHDWKRQPLKTGTGACRVRSFHGKYSEQGLEYLDNAINDWLDSHPEIEVKFVTSTVMTFEGKIREPALVLNVWY